MPWYIPVCVYRVDVNSALRSHPRNGPKGHSGTPGRLGDDFGHIIEGNRVRVANQWAPSIARSHTSDHMAKSPRVGRFKEG